MSNRYSFEDLKSEDTLVNFLEGVWLTGAITGKINTRLTADEIRNNFMPDFKNGLKINRKDI